MEPLRQLVTETLNGNFTFGRQISYKTYVDEYVPSVVRDYYI